MYIIAESGQDLTRWLHTKHDGVDDVLGDSINTKRGREQKKNKKKLSNIHHIIIAMRSGLHVPCMQWRCDLCDHCTVRSAVSTITRNELCGPSKKLKIFILHCLRREKNETWKLTLAIHSTLKCAWVARDFNVFPSQHIFTVRVDGRVAENWEIHCETCRWNRMR